LFFALLLNFSNINGQVFVQNLDSLKIVLKNAKHDTTKCNTLNAIIEAEADDNVWPRYNKQLLEIAECNIFDGNKLNFFYLKHQAGAFNNIGFLMSQQGNVTKAIEYYTRSLKIQEQINDNKGKATVLNNLAYIYNNQGDVRMALNYFHKSLKIQEEIKDKKGMGISLNNLGLIYDAQKDYANALAYYNKSLNVRKSINDKLGITSSLINISSIKIASGDTLNAINYLKECITLQKEINNEIGMAFSLNNLGTIYLWQGNLNDALDYLTKSLKISERIEDIDGMVFSLNGLALVNIKQGNINEAYLFAAKSMNLAQKLGFPVNIKNSAATLKQIFQKQNKHKEAFKMYELEITMRDSINNQETQKATIKKQLQYAYEKKELETKAEQNKKDAIAKAELNQKENERNYFIAGFGLVLVLALFIFKGYKQKQKANAIILEQKHLVDEKQKEILDSIHYAKRIQTALIPSEKYIDKNLNRLNIH